MSTLIIVLRNSDCGLASGSFGLIFQRNRMLQLASKPTQACRRAARSGDMGESVCLRTLPHQEADSKGWLKRAPQPLLLNYPTQAEPLEPVPFQVQERYQASSHIAFY